MTRSVKTYILVSLLNGERIESGVFVQSERELIEVGYKTAEEFVDDFNTLLTSYEDLRTLTVTFKDRAPVRIRVEAIAFVQGYAEIRDFAGA